MDGTLTVTSTRGHSWPGSNDNEYMLQTPQDSTTDAESIDTVYSQK